MKNFSKSKLKEELSNILTNFDRTRIYSSLINSNYICPIHDTDILKSLSAETHSRNIDKNIYYNQNIDQDERELIYEQYHSIKKMIMGVGFNPKKDYEPKRFFVENKDNKINLNKVYDVLEKRMQSHIYYCGEKGSGKTFQNNIWLSENNDLLESKKVFWVRCDAHKLYNIWKEVNYAQAQFITIDEYLKLQFLYVFVKYIGFDDREFINKIYHFIDTNKLKYNKVVSKHKINGVFQTVEFEVKTSIDKLNKIIKRYERYSVEKKSYQGSLQDSNYSYIVEVMKNSQISEGRYKTELLNLSEAIQSFLIDKGYKFLYIVDGVDNINIENLSNRNNFYYKMLIELEKFISSTFSNSYVKLVIGREKTYIDILSLNESGVPRNIYAPNAVDINVINHLVVEFSEILQERIKYITKTSKNSIFVKILAQLFNSDLFKLDNRKLSNEDLYHRNIRNFLMNMLNLSLMVTFRYFQLPKEHRSKFNILNTINNFIGRNRILNGTLYLNYRYDNNENEVTNYGRYFFNLFSYNELSSINWDGLLVTRILQLFSIKPFHKEVEILEFLHDAFGYSKLKTFKMINKLKTFGAIDTKIKEEIVYDGDINYVREVKGYIISHKGKFILDLIYSDIHIIYACILDTNLPNKFLEKNLIKAYDNTSYHKSYYNSCCFISTLTFFLFIYTVEEKEKEIFLLNRERLSRFDFFSQGEYSNFELPIHNKKIKVRILNSLISLYEEDSEDGTFILNGLLKVKEMFT